MKGPNGSGFATKTPGSSFNPAGLSGLSLWLDGRQNGFLSDGTTIATVPFGQVKFVSSPAPLGSAFWQSVNDANRVWRDNQAFDFHIGDPGQLSPGSIPAIAANNYTIALAVQIRASLVANSLIESSYGGSGFLTGITCAGDQLFIGSQSTPHFLASVPPGFARIELVARFGTNTIDAKGLVNSTPFNQSFAVTPDANNLATIFAGFNKGQFSLSQLLFVNRSVTDNERDNLMSFLQANATQNPPIQAPLMTIVGDSIGAGSGATPASSGFMSLVQTNLNGNATPPRMVNPSSFGATIDGLIGIYPTQIAPLFNPSRSKNIIVLQCCTNSLNATTPGEAATAAAAASASIRQLAAMVRATGFKSIIGTCLPSTNAGKGASFETARNLYNADIRANYASFCDAIADFGAASGMSLPADAASGPNFQADHLHVTAAGYVIMASVIQPVIAGML